MSPSLVMEERIETTFQTVDQYCKAEVGAQTSKLSFVEWGVEPAALLWWNCALHARRTSEARTSEKQEEKNTGIMQTGHRVIEIAAWWE